MFTKDPILTKKIIIRPVKAEITWSLRHEVLRPNQPFDSVKYQEDSDLDAMHFAAFKSEDEKNPIGVVSLFKEALILQKESILEPEIVKKMGWHLRSMAIQSDFQRLHIGSLLLNACYEYVLKNKNVPAGIWCNARPSVTEYYQRNGFQKVGELFELSGKGLHFLMINPDPTIRSIQLKSLSEKLISAEKVELKP